MTDKVKQEKYLAAQAAVKYIESGMTVGLGSGSTAEIAVSILAEKLRNGELKDIIGVPSSRNTRILAEKEGVPLTCDNVPTLIHLTIDGADAFDTDLQLIKGGGGALLYEKIVASASEAVIIIVDSRKQPAILGTTFDLPVEVIPLSWMLVASKLENFGAKTQIRKKDGGFFVTDEGNYILDCHFGAIDKPRQLAAEISQLPGVVEHGLFIDMATKVIIAEGDSTREIEKTII